MVLILIFPEIPRVLGAYEKSKKRGSFHKHHGAYKNKMSVISQVTVYALYEECQCGRAR